MVVLDLVQLFSRAEISKRQFAETCGHNAPYGLHGRWNCQVAHRTARVFILARLIAKIFGAVKLLITKKLRYLDEGALNSDCCEANRVKSPLNSNRYLINE